MRKILASLLLSMAILSPVAAMSEPTKYGYESVEGNKIFFREAGNPSKPTIVLLHGFPSSSHQYRNLIKDLGDDYHLIAPDYPGFGASDFPSQDKYTYTFDNIAETINTFLEQRSISKYSLFIHDYGAPIGLRIATKHPERVQSLIVQNGNAYEEGLNKETWGGLMHVWKNGRSAEIDKQIIDSAFSEQGLRWQYTHGTKNPDAILPDNWLLDVQAFARPGQHEMHLSLFYDYRNNVKLYPEWQAYLRKHQPPALIVWAKNDAYFPVPGAEGYKRDLKDVDYNILDTGHFALEEKAPLVAEKIRTFLKARDIK
ncbi:MAG: alpha/beta hydrolase [Hyphomicrobiales bacterium]